VRVRRLETAPQSGPDVFPWLCSHCFTLGSIPRAGLRMRTGDDADQLRRTDAYANATLCPADEVGIVQTAQCGYQQETSRCRSAGYLQRSYSKGRLSRPSTSAHAIWRGQVSPQQHHNDARRRTGLSEEMKGSLPSPALQPDPPRAT